MVGICGDFTHGESGGGSLRRRPCRLVGPPPRLGAVRLRRPIRRVPRTASGGTPPPTPYVDRVGDVNPDIRFESARQQDGGDLVGRAGVGKVQRESRRRGHSIEQRQSGDAVIAMIEVLLPEEHRRRIVTADHVRVAVDERPPQFVPECSSSTQFAIGIAQIGHTGQTDKGRRLFELGGPGARPVRRLSPWDRRSPCRRRCRQ